MKFVCDNCQAKYQIGDDKVAGKTVRMKCRKCGYNIKVTPAGVSDASPAEVPPPEAEVRAAPPVAATPAPAPAPHAPHAAPPAARSTWSEGDEESTAIMNAPVRDAIAAAIGPQAPRAVPKPPAPRPVTTAPHAARPVTAAGVPRPMSPAPGRTVPGVGTAPPRPVSRQSSSSMAAVQHEHTPYGTPHPASQAALHAVPPAALYTAPELEWYVGIGGSPIGPVRVSVIRERAAAHEVDGESLVWREGLAEWRPLRTFPELLEVVTAAQSARAAPTPTPFAQLAAAPVAAAPVAATPVAAAPVAAAPTPVAAAPVAAAPVAAAPAPIAAAPAPAPVPIAAAPAPAPAPVPIAAAPAPAPQAAHAPSAAAAPVVVGDPFAAPSPFGLGPGAAQNGKVNGLHLANSVDAAAPRSPFVAEAPSAPKPSSADIDPAVEEALVPRRGNTHPLAYAFIAAAAAFGGVAAYVLLLRPPPAPAIATTATAATAAPTVTPSATAMEDKGQPQVEVGDISPVGSARPAVHVGGPMPKATATAGTAAPIDTSGFVPNVPGPAATGPSPSAGGQLSQGEMNGVVAQNQPRVRRKCWQPALDGQGPTGPKNARVTVNINIAASGNVESATATGADRDFPGLASCIAGMVRGWKFPASGGPTSVNVPFVFAGQ